MKCSRCGKEIPDGENKLCEDCQKSLLNEISSNENEFKVVKEEKDTKKKKSSKGEKTTTKKR